MAFEIACSCRSLQSLRVNQRRQAYCVFVAEFSLGPIDCRRGRSQLEDFLDFAMVAAQASAVTCWQ